MKEKKLPKQRCTFRCMNDWDFVDVDLQLPDIESMADFAALAGLHIWMQHWLKSHYGRVNIIHKK